MVVLGCAGGKVDCRIRRSVLYRWRHAYRFGLLMRGGRIRAKLLFAWLSRVHEFLKDHLRVDPPG